MVRVVAAHSLSALIHSRARRRTSLGAPPGHHARMRLSRNQLAGINSGARTREYHRRTGRTYSGHLIWSDVEIQKLREAWPDRRRAVASLPGRTLHAIDGKAAKLGLRSPGHQWTANEASRFRKLWRTASREEILAAFPWATWTALQNYSQWQRANGHPDVRRPKASPSTGDPFVDSILARAKALNMTLVELDATAGTGRYFTACRHRWRRSWGHLARAAVALGGTLKVEFSDD